MKTITKILASALLIQLAGCETYYKAPDASNAAKVRFTTSAANQKILVTVYDGPGCQIGSNGGIVGAVGGISRDPAGSVPPDIKSSGNTLGMIGYSEGPVQPIERLLPARSDLTFATFRLVDASMFSGLITVKTCATTYQFSPLVGGEYEINYFESPTHCGAQAFRLSTTPEGAPVRIAEPSLRSAPVQCTGKEAVK